MNFMALMNLEKVLNILCGIHIHELTPRNFAHPICKSNSLRIVYVLFSLVYQYALSAFKYRPFSNILPAYNVPHIRVSVFFSCTHHEEMRFLHSE